MNVIPMVARRTGDRRARPEPDRERANAPSTGSPMAVPEESPLFFSWAAPGAPGPYDVMARRVRSLTSATAFAVIPRRGATVEADHPTIQQSRSTVRPGSGRASMTRTSPSSLAIATLSSPEFEVVSCR